jgi:hypothetical protein
MQIYFKGNSEKRDRVRTMEDALLRSLVPVVLLERDLQDSVGPDTGLLIWKEFRKLEINPTIRVCDDHSQGASGQTPASLCGLRWFLRFLELGGISRQTLFHDRRCKYNRSFLTGKPSYKLNMLGYPKNVFKSLM